MFLPRILRVSETISYSYFSSFGSRAADEVAPLARDNITYLNSSPLLPALSTVDCFSFSPVSCEVVRRVILSLPLNKAPDPDKIKAKVFRLPTSSAWSHHRDHQLFLPYNHFSVRLEDSRSYTPPYNHLTTGHYHCLTARPNFARRSL